LFHSDVLRNDVSIVKCHLNLNAGRTQDAISISILSMSSQKMGFMLKKTFSFCYLKVEKVDEIDICSSVHISGDDEANRLASEYLGQFDAIKGKYSAGRMVYKNEESGKTLEVRPGVTNWLIFDDKPGVIASGNGANSMNPADPVAARSLRFPNRKSWGFGIANNEYRTNLNLSFECLP